MLSFFSLQESLYVFLNQILEPKPNLFVKDRYILVACMKVILNQEEIFVGNRVSLRDLLAGKGITPDGNTIAVNNMVIPFEEWHTTMLADGCKVRVAQATSSTDMFF